MNEEQDTVKVKYRQRPIEVDAILWDGEYNSINLIIKKTSHTTYGYTYKGIEYSSMYCSLIVHGYEKDINICKGEYIVFGLDEKIYVYSPKIFFKLYEKVE